MGNPIIMYSTPWTLPLLVLLRSGALYTMQHYHTIISNIQYKQTNNAEKAPSFTKAFRYILLYKHLLKAKLFQVHQRWLRRVSL